MKRMKKMFSWLLCVCMVIGMIADNTVLAKAEDSVPEGYNILNDYVAFTCNEDVYSEGDSTRKYTLNVYNRGKAESLLTDISVYLCGITYQGKDVALYELDFTVKNDDGVIINSDEIVVEANQIYTYYIEVTLPDDFNDNRGIEIRYNFFEDDMSSLVNARGGVATIFRTNTEIERFSMQSEIIGIQAPGEEVTICTQVTNLSEEEDLKDLGYDIYFRTSVIGNTIETETSELNDVYVKDDAGNVITDLSSYTVSAGETVVLYFVLTLPNEYTNDSYLILNISLKSADLESFYYSESCEIKDYPYDIETLTMLNGTTTIDKKMTWKHTITNNENASIAIDASTYYAKNGTLIDNVVYTDEQGNAINLDDIIILAGESYTFFETITYPDDFTDEDVLTTTFEYYMQDVLVCSYEDEKYGYCRSDMFEIEGDISELVFTPGKDVSVKVSVKNIFGGDIQVDEFGVVYSPDIYAYDSNGILSNFEELEFEVVAEDEEATLGSVISSDETKTFIYTFSVPDTWDENAYLEIYCRTVYAENCYMWDSDTVPILYNDVLNSAEQEDTTEPEQPVEPEEPTEPEQPVEPEQPSEPELPENGWYEDEDGNKMYFKDGKAIKSQWLEDKDAWYYFDKDGFAVADWQSIGGTWYYFDQECEMKTGWLELDGTWYYLNDSGAMLTGWQVIGGAWYYFYGSGAMAESTWVEGSYVGSSGAWVETPVAEGWRQSGGKWWYQLPDSSYPANEWKSIGGEWYYFDASGYMATGWLNDAGTWYYMEEGGAMKTGWVEIIEKDEEDKEYSTWYYMEQSGAMKTGWHDDGGTWYYLNASGLMVTDTVIDGYKIDKNGVWVQ